MRNKFCVGKRGIVAALVVLGMMLAIVPSFSQSEEPAPVAGTDAEDGKAQGTADARSNALWFLSGLLLPGVGMILPWVFSPAVPSDKLIGKSDEFVDAYRKAYIDQTKFGNFLWSLAGFGATVTVVGVTSIIVVGRATIGIADSCGDALANGCGSALTEACSNAIPTCSSPTCSNLTCATPTLSCGGLGLLPPEAFALLAPH